MKLTRKEIKKIKQLFELANGIDSTIVLEKEGKRLYLMNKKAYNNLKQSNSNKN